MKFSVNPPVTTSDIAPTDVEVNFLWFDSTSKVKPPSSLYVGYETPSGDLYWVRVQKDVLYFQTRQQL